jgi:hypothetical protein
VLTCSISVRPAGHRPSWAACCLVAARHPLRGATCRLATRRRQSRRRVGSSTVCQRGRRFSDAASRVGAAAAVHAAGGRRAAGAGHFPGCRSAHARCPAASLRVLQVSVPMDMIGNDYSRSRSYRYCSEVSRSYGYRRSDEIRTHSK